MSIDDKFRSWNQQSINILQEGPGVYELYDENKTLIYIGESKNMKKRLQNYLDSNFAENPCNRDTKWFKREYNYNHKEREQELLDEYKKAHNGKLPKCNNIDA